MSSLPLAVTARDYVSALFYVYWLAIFAYIISSWIFALGVRVPYSGPLNAVLGFLRDICEPYLRIFRRILPPFGGLDLSPIIALLVLGIVERVVIGLIPA